LYESGLSLATVAERIGSSDETVARQLRQAGVSIRPQSEPKLSDEERQEAERLFLQGQSLAAIARQYNTSHTTVSKTLRRSIPAEYAERQAAVRQSAIDDRADQERTVLAFICQRGRASRLEISRGTGINYHTVRAITEQLLTDGSVRRVGQGRTTGYATSSEECSHDHVPA
jgi:DNA-binding CsgD family transcriptional regulator